MKKDDINNALDKALDSNFEGPSSPSVPMIIPEPIILPATITDEQKKIKENLYNVSEKLMAVMDYVTNNLDTLSDVSSMSLLKVSPVSDIVALANTIKSVNSKIWEFNEPPTKDEKPAAPGELHLHKHTGISLEDVDKMLKDEGLKDVKIV